MLITLTTDFGIDDPFVAIMKGVILGRCPDVNLVDICHTIPPQDIGTASHILAAAAPYFPPATIHVAVVDPGVGSSRRIICIKAADQFFLAPDNGLLTPFLSDAQNVYELTNDQLFLKPVSATFHGRDIFAPVAAAIAGGLTPQELGPSLQASDLVCLEFPRPTIDLDKLHGQCLRADNFGNMTTNIKKKDLEKLLTAGEIAVITVANTTITGLSPSYGPKKRNAIALINSSDHLEISIPGGNAAKELNLLPATPVFVQKILASEV